MPKPRIGLVGVGYWGPFHARVLAQNPNCEFAAVCDSNKERLEKTIRQYPSVKGFTSFDEVLDAVDALIIATPISTHYELAKKAIVAGKHVLVEKPLAHKAEYADELVSLARKHKRTLMTGHTFVYSPPVIKVREQIEAGTLGDLYYLSLSRVNLGLYQKDVDVLWDLAVHDISILLYWLREVPTKAIAFGRACVQQKKNDVAFLFLQFPSGAVAHIEVSWLSPQKMRRSLVIGSKRMVVYDDTEPSEKIKIYDRGVVLPPPSTFGEFQLTYRMGDMVAPNLSNREPLAAELENFVSCIQTGAEPVSSGEFGANVVRILEQAANSLEDRSETGSLATASVAVGD